MLLSVPDHRARPRRRRSARPGRSPTPGAELALGSDSHAVIDMFEEARAVELDERLASGERGRHDAASLLRAATADGHSCARLARGRARSSRARSPTWSRSASTACASPGRPPTRRSRRPCSRPPRADVERVVCGGREIVRDGRARGARRRRRAARVDRRGPRMTRDRDRPHRAPGHQRPRARRGAARDRPRRGAGDRGRARRRDRAGRCRRATSASTPRGRCVIPGFVDSHTHLVFAGDRAEEFAARMAGRAVRGRRDRA